MKTALFTLLCLFWTAGSCFGQEFRIYTKVYDETAVAGGNAPDTSVVARSLTLFHAGRVYDYMQSLGEVTIYEPMQDRFTILNTLRQLSTVVHTDEIKHLMQTAGKVARERIAGIRRGREGASSSTAKMLAFQLKPEFRNDFNRGRNRCRWSVRTCGTTSSWSSSRQRNTRRSTANMSTGFTS